jgi:hypothetical protein
MDEKDHIIEILRQQREEAQNRLATIIAKANVRIAELEAELKLLKDETDGGQ